RRHVDHRVLSAAVHLVSAGREHHERRVVAEQVEEAERREVDRAGGVDRRDPADRSRDDTRLQGVVAQAMVVLAGLVIHRCLFEIGAGPSMAAVSTPDRPMLYERAARRALSNRAAGPGGATACGSNIRSGMKSPGTSAHSAYAMPSSAMPSP